MSALIGSVGCRVQTTEGPPQHYDDPQAMIDVFEDKERDAWQQPDAVVDALPIPSPGAVVADIGAGSGYFTRRLAARVPEGRVYAVDIDSEFEAYVRTNRESWGTPNIEPIMGHYDDPKLPAASVDLVLSVNAYAYIRDRPAYFGRVRQALRPGGALAVLDFRPSAAVGDDVAPAPEHRVSVELAREELAQAGFTVLQEETFLPHQWFLILQVSP